MRSFQYIKHFKYFGILLVLIGCKKTDWKETYREKSKEPFGIYILHEEFEDLTGNEKEDLKKNFYDYMYRDYYDNDVEEKQTYFCIKNSPYKLTEGGIDELLNFVFEGNTAFFSCNYFPYYLEEKLNFSSNYISVDSLVVNTTFKKSKGSLSLENSNFRNKKTDFKGYLNHKYFENFNSNTTIVLGNLEVDHIERPNFIKIYHGKGAFYLHNSPIAFTNYSLLKKKQKYVENVLSYLPEGKVLWDLQIRSSTFQNKKNREQSIFQFFLKHKTLKWFLFVSLLGLLLFMLFNARRKQRPIPIIKPLENSTVAFTETIASLYLKEQDYKNMADKKIKFFLEKVRVKYLLETNNLNTKFIENLALKSGNDIPKTKYLINSIIAINKKSSCTEEELMVMYRMIENFFKK